MDTEMLTLLQSVVFQSSNIVFITDLDGKIVYCNKKLLEISGYREDEIIGKRPSLFKSGSTPPYEYKVLWDTIIASQPWYGILKNKKMNGEFYWVYSKITPIKNENGELTNFLAIQEDAHQLQQFSNQLFKKQKMEMLINFSSGMAHSINNILAVALGYLEFLQTKENTDEFNPNASELLPVIIRKLQGASELVHMVNKMQPEEIDVNDKIQPVNVIREELKSVYNSYLDNDVITLTDMTNKIIITGNHSLFKLAIRDILKVIIEILSDIKDPRIEITLTIGKEQDFEAKNVLDHLFANEFLAIRFDFSGGKINNDLLSSVFEPFSKGLGDHGSLGLAPAYYIIDSFGGTITSSTSEFITSFVIYLPINTVNCP